MITRSHNTAITAATLIRRRCAKLGWSDHFFVYSFQIGNHPLPYPHSSDTLCVGWLVGFVALRPKSTAMVIAGRSVHLTTRFSWAGLNKRITSNSCTYFRL